MTASCETVAIAVRAGGHSVAAGLAPRSRPHDDALMRPVGVHHVSLNVPDVDVAVAFYTQLLGGMLRGDRPALGFKGAWIDVGSQQVHLLEGVTPPGTGQHFALQVDDLDAAIDELRGSGIEVSNPSAIGSARQAFLHDPAGNLVELHQPAVI